MLSEKRKELLRKNKDKIAAYKANSDGFTVDSLKRFYPDGTFVLESHVSQMRKWKRQRGKMNLQS